MILIQLLLKFYVAPTAVLIITEQRCFATRKRKRSVSHDFANGNPAGDKSSEAIKEPMEVVTKSVVCGIVTRIDLLEYISNDGMTKSEF